MAGAGAPGAEQTKRVQRGGGGRVSIGDPIVAPGDQAAQVWEESRWHRGRWRGGGAGAGGREEEGARQPHQRRPVPRNVSAMARPIRQGGLKAWEARQLLGTRHGGGRVGRDQWTGMRRRRGSLRAPAALRAKAIHIRCRCWHSSRGGAARARKGLERSRWWTRPAGLGGAGVPQGGWAPGQPPGWGGRWHLSGRTVAVEPASGA